MKKFRIVIFLVFLSFGFNVYADDNEYGCISDLDSITIADGTFGYCRNHNYANGSAINCCEISFEELENRNKLITNAARIWGYIASPTQAALNDIFVETGLATDNWITALHESIIKWFGGDCLDEEIATATLSRYTEGVTVEDTNGNVVYNGDDDTGNCVYLGLYCHTYYNNCWDFGWIGGGKIDIVNDVRSDGSSCNISAMAYCCYSNMFERALAKAARDQMPDKYNWGTINGDVLNPDNPREEPGKNACSKDTTNNVDCSGVSIADFVNLNLNSEQFQTDITAYAYSLINDIMSEDGAFTQLMEQYESNINEIKNIDSSAITEVISKYE